MMDRQTDTQTLIKYILDVFTCDSLTEAFEDRAFLGIINVVDIPM